MPINALFSAHPTPPHQPAVGSAPTGFLKKLPPGFFDPNQFGAFNLNAPLTRAEVRQICTSPNINPLAAYAVAMAWGGQRADHFGTSVLAPILPDLLDALRVTQRTPAADFLKVQGDAARIIGLDTAFYTKLLYFFRPLPDAYILDQWTAKSMCIVNHPSPVRLGQRGKDGYYPPAKNTTKHEYESYCSSLAQLALTLWHGTGAGAEFAEAAIFDEGDGRGLWRNFVEPHFVHRPIADAIRFGGECMTTMQDFFSGLFVVKSGLTPTVYVSPSTATPTILRILLARLRQLGACAVHFLHAVGPSVPLPDWFMAGCKQLNVSVVTKSRESQEQPVVEQSPNNRLHLSFIGNGPKMRLHWAGDDRNQGYIQPAADRYWLCLKNTFAQQRPDLLAAVVALPQFRPPPVPWGGANYCGAAPFQTKAASISLLVQYNVSMLDNTVSPPQPHPQFGLPLPKQR